MLKLVIYLVSVFAASLLLVLLPMHVGLIADIIVKLLTVILFAVASYVYPRVILPGTKWAWLRSALCPLLLTVPYAIVYWGNADVFQNVLRIFIWCEVWALIGCVSRAIRMRKKEMEIDDSQALRTVIPFYWFWMPLIHYAVFVLGYLHTYYAVVDLYGKDYGSMVILLCLLVTYDVVLTPLLTIMYCRKIHKMGIGWAKYLLCIYNAGIMCTFFALCNLATLDTIQWSLSKIVFYSVVSIEGIPVLISGLVCGFATLIICDIRAALKKRKENREIQTVTQEAT